MALRNRLTTLTAASILAMIAATGVGAQNPELPSLKVGSASAVSTSAASSYYGTVNPRPADLHLNSDVAVEIKALARALKNDPELMFNYVHDKIEYVPQFGLQKGALGAYVDQAGTAFDQAQLLVQLLREARYADAQYVIGNVSLSAQQMDDWFGDFDSNTARCQMLYDGGIPANACGSSATIMHAWVQVTIDGSIVQLDPSFKKHNEITPRITDLKAAMNYGGRTGFLNAAGGASKSLSGQQGYSGFNSTQINLELNQLSDALITEINKSTNYDASLSQLIGNREIVTSVEDSAEGFDGTSNALGTGTSYDDIPDSYRTLVTLNFYEEGVDTLTGTPKTRTFFGDEIYGRHLSFEWTESNIVAGRPVLASIGQLKLEGDTVLEIEPAGANDLNPDRTLDVRSQNRTNQAVGGEEVAVEFVIDHAYAADGGSYMDRRYLRARGGFSQPITFVFGFGGPTSDEMTARISSEHMGDVMHDVQDRCVLGNSRATSGLSRAISEPKLSDTLKNQIAYGWLSQFSRAVDLQSRVVDAETQLHHSFGAVLSTTNWEEICEFTVSETNPSYPWIYSLVDSAMQIDVLSGISVNQKDGDATGRQATIQSIATIGAALEGSVFEQFADRTAPASTVERFGWASEFDSSSGFFIVDSSNFTTVQNAALQQTLAPDNAQRKYVGSGAGTDGFLGLSAAYRISDYIDQGYVVIAPQGDNLGPGTLRGEQRSNGTMGFGRSFERGSAFVAFKPDSGEVAHIIFTGKDLAKGGGAAGGDDDEGAGNSFDPTKVADLLRDNFEDRSQLHGVDLASGQLTFSPAADVTTGNGGFPYEMAFQRRFAAGGARSRGMAAGWTHNWNLAANMSGSGTEAMGATKAVRAVPSLVAMLVMQDIYAGNSGNLTTNSTVLKNMLVPMLVSNWWTEQLHHNVVTVEQGPSTTQFVRLPKKPGTATERYDAPEGVVTDLIQTGALLNDVQIDGCTDAEKNLVNDACKRRYSYENTSFTMKSADGSEIILDLNAPEGLQANPNVPRWRASKWSFASDVEYTFQYDPLYHRLERIQSNHGNRSIQLTWSDEKIASVSATGGMTASFGYDVGGTREGRASPYGTFQATASNTPLLTSVTNALGETTQYKYVGNGLNAAAYPAGLTAPAAPADTYNDWVPRLYEVLTPEYTQTGAASFDGLASQRFTYDETWRVATLEDGEAIRGNRPLTPAAWEFFVAPEFRGERVAPMVKDEQGNSVRPAYEVMYDDESRGVRFTDEGGLITTASYDGINRVLERTFPSGIKSQFSYDQNHNVEEFTTVAADGTTSRTVMAEYTDSNWVTKPTSVTDAMGNTTSISYIAPGSNGAGQPDASVLPPVTAGQTIKYEYSYNRFGQLLTVRDPEGMVTANAYDANGFLASVIQDSGRENLITSFTYDDAGNQLTVNGPRDDVADITSVAYDALRRPITQTDPVQTQSTTIYDKNGRTVRTEVLGADGTLQVSGQSYTATGQTFQTFSPECYSGTSLNTGRADCAVTVATYDGMDRSDIVTDPEGRQSQTVYFESGDVARVMRAVGTPLQQAYQTYTYYGQGEYGAGQVQTVADANGNTTGYVYDTYNRLTRTNFPSKTVEGQINTADYEKYIYDDNDNQIAKRTRDADYILNTYDVLNRITTKIVHNGGLYIGSEIINGSSQLESTYNYTYDRLGRDLTIEKSGHTITYTYDTAGRLTSEDQNGRVVAVGYNEAGARDRLTYPQQGTVDAKIINFTYDAAGRMDMVTEGSTTLLANYAYDDLSRKTSLTYLNGASSGYTYHVDSAIDRITQNFATTVDNVAYTFGYNKANQVTNRNISNIAYVFDGFEDEGSTSYTTNGLNQYEGTSAAPLLASGEIDPNPAPETVVATNYSYDDNGNLQFAGKWLYSYDVENRLTGAVNTVDNVLVTFQYDGKGRRIAKSVDSNGDFAPDIFYEYLYEGDEPIQDYLKIGTGNDYVINHRYLHGASVDERLVHWQYDQNTGAELKEQFYHRDHQGSIIAMSDASGGRAVGELYTYDAYGNQVSGSLTGQPFRYTGRRYDAETGLYYYRARYYSADIGRFLQTDPIGYEDNMNLYGYVGNDPVNNTDPFGLESIPEIVTSCPEDGPLICGFFNDDDNDDEDNTFDILFDFAKFIGITAEESQKEARKTAQETAEAAADVALTTLQCAANETGLDTLVGAGLAASGANVIPTRGKFGGSTPGTSPASVGARKLAGNAKFPAGVRVPAPTLNAPFATTARVGTAAGRLVPLLGAGLLAKDAVGTVECVFDGGVSNGE